MLRRVIAPFVVALVFSVAGCATGNNEPPGGAPAADGGGSPPAASAQTPVAPASPGAGTAAVPQALAFTAKTLDGKDFSGASLAGKPVMFWFWAPWCVKCRAAAPDVAKAAQRVPVVGVPGLSDDTASMRRFVAETRTEGLTHLGAGAEQVWSRFDVTSQDTYVLIDSNGAVVYKGGLDAAALARRVSALT